MLLILSTESSYVYSTSNQFNRKYNIIENVFLSMRAHKHIIWCQRSCTETKWKGKQSETVHCIFYSKCIKKN